MSDKLKKDDVVLIKARVLGVRQPPDSDGNSYWFHPFDTVVQVIGDNGEVGQTVAIDADLCQKQTPRNATRPVSV